MIGTCPGVAAERANSRETLGGFDRCDERWRIGMRTGRRCCSRLGVAPGRGGRQRSSVSIVAATTFEDNVPDGFTTTGLPGCASGIVENGPVNFAFNPALNVFAGFKVFVCANEANGFVLRLNARFGEGGSVGDLERASTPGDRWPG